MRKIIRGVLVAVLAWSALVVCAAEKTWTFPARESAARPVVGQGWTLPAFAGGEGVTIEVRARDVSATGQTVYRGRTTDSAYNNASVAVTSSGYVVTVQLPSGGRRVYRLAEGAWTVRERAPSASRGRCGTGAADLTETSARTKSAAKAVELTGDPLVDGRHTLARGETVTNEIDVLIAFDSSAAQWVRERSDFAGEANAVDLFAADALAKVNNTYANTDLDRFFTFRLAGTYVLERDVSTIRDEDQNVDVEKILEYLLGDGSRQAQFKPVRAYRDVVSADIVSFLVACGDDDPSGTVGIGFPLNDETIGERELPEGGYNVCLIEQVAKDATLAHEIGHNMGAGHAKMKDAEASGPMLYNYSIGYYFDVTNATGAVFRHAATVMAYDSDGYEDDYGWDEYRWGEFPESVVDETDGKAPLISERERTLWNEGLHVETLFFSSSTHTYKYVSNDGSLIETGIPLGDGLHDNTHLLSLTYPVIANYRVRRSRLTVSAPEGGALSLSGSGVLEPGKKLRLRAKAEKGSVFAGWYTQYDAASGTFSEPFTDASADYRKNALTYTVPDEAQESLAIQARFATTEEDAASLAVRSFDLTTDVLGRLEYTLTDEDVTSLSLPRVSVRGLPSGLRFNAKTMTISGTARRAGVYTATLSAMNVSVRKPVTATITVTVQVLPDWSVGTFDGLCTLKADGSDETRYGILRATVSRTGSLSGKVRIDLGDGRLTTASFKASDPEVVQREDSAASVAALRYADVTLKGPRGTSWTTDLLVSADSANEGLGILTSESGRDGCTVSARQNPWLIRSSAASLKIASRQTVALEPAEGPLASLELVVKPKGIVSAKGRDATGRLHSVSGQLCVEEMSADRLQTVACLLFPKVNALSRIEVVLARDEAGGWLVESAQEKADGE